MHGDTLSFSNQEWLKNTDLQRILTLLEDGGNEARVVGGAVRNALLNEPVDDIDIATTFLPQAVIDIGEQEGFKVVKMGLDYGTVKLCKGRRIFEITTLRRDIKSDGRHAQVIFGTDWQDDAERRDFTMNALYVDRHGTLYDPISGLNDLHNRCVRFIGVPQSRIKEDYLRILRFFRFHAYYGRSRPDAEGLKACVQLRDNLSTLSGERIWQELSRLLQAPNPSISILWMHQSGVLPTLLPESQNWGLDVFHGLLSLEEQYDWSPDELLRLMSLLPIQESSIEDIKKRFKLSGREFSRLHGRVLADSVDWNVSQKQFIRKLYIHNSPDSVQDYLRLAMSRARINKDKKLEKRLFQRYQWSCNYTRPKIPVTAKDLMHKGFKEGLELGAALDKLEEKWIISDFTLTKEQLLSNITAI